MTTSTFLAAGAAYSTLSKEGANLALCTTINTTANPEYPALPFALGEVTEGTDGSTWVYAKPAANYAIGTFGWFDASWNFTAITTTAASGISGYKMGCMSQVASVTATPTSTLYDGVWVQTSGGCPGILCAASTSAFAQLYTYTVAGELNSSSGGGAVAINGVIIITAVGASAAANAVGVLNFPELSLTT